MTEDEPHKHEPRKPNPNATQHGRYHALSALPQGVRNGALDAAVPHDGGMAETSAPLTPTERVDRALVLLVYFIELDGDVHIPLFEKFEAELQALRQAEDTKTRARQLLAAYSRSGGLNAICSRNLSLSSSDGPLPYLGL